MVFISNVFRSFCIIALLRLLTSGIEAVAAEQIPALEAEKAGIREAVGKLPLFFIENQGQKHADVTYYVQGTDKTLYFTSTGITFALKGEKSAERWSVKMDFVGANPLVEPRGEDQREAVFSYFKGQPEDWETGVSTFGELVYEELWPGIDLVYSGDVNQLKYEFVVKPHADPKQIRFTYRGATEVTLQESGALRIDTPMHGFEDGRPFAFQERDGERTEVSMTYALAEKCPEGSYSYGFQVGEYDPQQTLILDPVYMQYCGYIGGMEGDVGMDVAFDSKNYLYVTGWAYSTEIDGFPVTTGPYTVHGGGRDAFVAKIVGGGTVLAYCGYIGGTQIDSGFSIAVDGIGQAYVAGETKSDAIDGFPVLVGPDLTHNGAEDIFVAKVNANGTGLVYCGYIGGVNQDFTRGIAINDQGHAFIGGSTGSDETTFPVLVGPDLTYNGGFDAFVAKVKADGSGLDYCGYLGGTSAETGKTVAVDNAGNAYVTGTTQSTELQNFPVLVGPDLTYNGGNFDGFVAKVNAGGTGLVYCGYIGGSETEYADDVAVDNVGRAYVTGTTWSSETDGFPVTVGPDLTFGPPSDGFVARIAVNGAGFDYCGYVGGSANDSCSAVGVDLWGRAYVTGSTASSDLPVAGGPFLTYNGAYDAFVANVKINGTGLVHCGYIGGTSWDVAYGIDVTPRGAVAVTGQTYSTESMSFPVFIGPDLTHNGGVTDAWVAVFQYKNPYAGPLLTPIQVVSIPYP